MYALEARHAPVVSLWVWYHVGGRNEVPGTTGMSHFLEHMLFKGTPGHPKGDLDRLLARYGAMWNAFTSEDVTCYFETVPRGRCPADHPDRVPLPARDRSPRARAFGTQRRARGRDRRRR